MELTAQTVVVPFGAAAAAVLIPTYPESQLLEAAVVLDLRQLRVVTLYLVVTAAQLAIELMLFVLFPVVVVEHPLVQTLLVALAQTVMQLLFLGKVGI